MTVTTLPPGEKGNVYLSGPAMRREREARGLTQADVARAVNALAGELLAAQPGVSAIETGSDRRPFTEWQAMLYAVAVQVPLSALLARPVRLDPERVP
jgi:transcriptional regulator with XRE-family HTH domain